MKPVSERAPIRDFDAAYSNVDAIEGAADYPPRWAAAAEAFRQGLLARGRAELDLAYGAGERNRFDLFWPDGDAPRGLVVFVHGGYWRAFDKSLWSHLAHGPLAQGYAVAMPSYTLCPQIRISGIGEEIAGFLDAAAAHVDGPIRLSGHSAGGQLVTRAIAKGSSLPDTVRERIRTVVSISGVHDLRPLMATRLNELLRLDDKEALAESPIALRPDIDAEIVALVGGKELPEFRRQNALLADVWHGLGARTRAIEAPSRHHFDVVDALADPLSELTLLLTGGSTR